MPLAGGATTRVFVTGASGHLGSAVVPELLAAGHDVVGLARSDAAAAAVADLGAGVRRGSLDDLDGLRRAAADADGVIHLAYRHDLVSSGQPAVAVGTELAAVNALGDALAGSGKALVVTSGTLAAANLGRPATEDDRGEPGGRTDAEDATLGFAARDIRASVVRLPPLVHSAPDRHGLVRDLLALARRTGVAGYAGGGQNRWPAVHARDAARVYRLALEEAPPGTRWHAVADEGIPQRALAQALAAGLGVAAEGIPPDRVQDHFGSLAAVIVLDNPATAAVTRRVLGWEPAGPALLDDLGPSGYFER